MTTLVSLSVAAIARALVLGPGSAFAQSHSTDNAAMVSTPVESGTTPAFEDRASDSATPKGMFATLAGVDATPMSSGELSAVKGLHVHFLDAHGGFHLAGRLDEKNWMPGPDGLIAPSYNGLCVAMTRGGISIPGGSVQCP